MLTTSKKSESQKEWLFLCGLVLIFEYYNTQGKVFRDICLYLNGCTAPTDRLDLCVISRRIHQQIGFTSSFHRYSYFHVWQSDNAKKSLRFFSSEISSRFSEFLTLNPSLLDGKTWPTVDWAKKGIFSS